MIVCFPGNVFEVSDPVTVVSYGTNTLLLAMMRMMEELLRVSKKWKYFINFTGEEFPLLTNLELVSVLKKLRGRNIVDG